MDTLSMAGRFSLTDDGDGVLWTFDDPQAEAWVAAMAEADSEACDEELRRILGAVTVHVHRGTARVQ